MQITVHRGTHQIGGVATEIRTSSARILIDMGDELSNEADFSPNPLSIAGVTDDSDSCDGVLFTHYHGDHVGQLKNIRAEIPVYMGALTKDVLLASCRSPLDPLLKNRLKQARIFEPGNRFAIGDILITPFWVDHSACDSYMFLLEAEGKRVLHTGDFRLHGFRGKALPKLLRWKIGKVDVLIIEGTHLSRSGTVSFTERQLQQQVKKYMQQYKYVFVLCAATQLERICALAKAVPAGKYFVCDGYQNKLLDLLQRHWGNYSALYRNLKKITYGKNLHERFAEKGFLMMVRDNRQFRSIIRRFDPHQSVILYSMWDGYRTRPNSSLPDFLNLSEHWAPLHTSGHSSQADLQQVIQKLSPRRVIPIHTEYPEGLSRICPTEKIVLLQDGQVWSF